MPRRPLFLALSTTGVARARSKSTSQSSRARRPDSRSTSEPAAVLRQRRTLPCARRTQRFPAAPCRPRRRSDQLASIPGAGGDRPDPSESRRRRWSQAPPRRRSFLELCRPLSDGASPVAWDTPLSRASAEMRLRRERRRGSGGPERAAGPERVYCGSTSLARPRRHARRPRSGVRLRRTDGRSARVRERSLPGPRSCLGAISARSSSRSVWMSMRNSSVGSRARESAV